MPSTLLSETLFGFFCSLALFLTGETLGKRSTSLAIVTGLAFGAAAMTNAVLIPFAPLLALVLFFCRIATRRLTVTLAISALLLPAAWGGRNVQLPTGESASTRAAMNFVQGSWPNYHSGFELAMRGAPEGIRAMAAIDAELYEFQNDKINGLGVMLSRMTAHPWLYLRWYLSKPALLWSWDIRVGQGDIYVYPTRHSPFRDNAFFLVIISIARGLNLPLLFFACFACLHNLMKRRPDSGFAMTLLVLFTTAVYTILQSEPRYSIALRGEEIFLATFGAHYFFQMARAMRGSNADPLAIDRNQI